MLGTTRNFTLIGCLLLCSVTLMLGNIQIDDIMQVDENCGQADGSLVIVATSFDSMDLSYSIDGGTIFQSSNTFDNLSKGDYLIVVSDGTSCSEVFTAQLASSNFEDMPASVTGGICSGSISLSLSENNVTNLQWYRDGVALAGENSNLISITGSDLEVGAAFHLEGIHASGCIISTKAFVVEADQIVNEISMNLCDGDTLNIDGFPTILQTGIYENLNNLFNGCDSITRLVVDDAGCIVFDASGSFVEFSEIEGEICRGLSLKVEYEGASDFQWYKDGEVFMAETSSVLKLYESNSDVLGIYYCEFDHEGISYQTVTYELIEIPSYDIYLGEVSMCPGDSIQFGPFVLRQEGFFEYRTTASNGCDSLESIDVRIYEVPSEIIEAELCDGDTLVLSILPVDFPPIVSAGSYEVNLVSDDGCDYVTTVDVVNIDCSIGTATNNLVPIGVNLMPNPTSGQLKIQAKSAIRKISILDFKGRVLLDEFVSNGLLEVALDLEEMLSGLYLVQVSTENGQAVEKLIVE